MHLIRSEPLPLVVLEPPDYALLQTYYLDNKDHLAPWEPARDESYYAAASMRDLVAERYRQYEDKTALHLCAIDDGRMVAECNFTNIVRGPFQACSLGFSVAKEREGRGVMTGVVKQGVAIMFSDYGLHRIEANYMPRNARSPRVLERCGFVREGFARAYLKIAGQWEDHVLTALVSTSDRYADVHVRIPGKALPR